MPIPNRRERNDIISRNPRVSVGLDFPVSRIPNADGYFATTKTTDDAVKSNIRLFLLTQRGERLMQPNLGLNLRRFLFEPVNENTAIEIENNIVESFDYWMPFVQLHNIDVDLSQQDANKIGVRLEFKINNGSNKLSSVEVEIG